MFKAAKYLLITLICFGCLHLRSQNDASKNNTKQMLWFAYYNRIQIKENLVLATDIQFRTTEWIREPAQALVRTLKFSNFKKTGNKLFSVCVVIKCCDKN